MITGAEMLLISGGLNAASTVMNIGAINGEEKANAIIAAANARIAKQDAEQEATRLRDRGAATAGAARTALAASGVDLAGGGTVDVIEQDIRRTTERDAYAALLGGERLAEQYTTEAGNARRRAKDAVTSGVLQIGGTVMGTMYGIDRWQRGMG